MTELLPKSMYGKFQKKSVLTCGNEILTNTDLMKNRDIVTSLFYAGDIYFLN